MSHILKSDFDPCVCGHDAAFHCKQFTNLGGPTNVLNDYLHCEWNEMNKWGETMWGAKSGCECRKFKVDNLTVLLRKHEYNLQK